MITGTGLARVTIRAPRRRIDVALPEHAPVAELLPELLRHAGEGLADDGERHGGWLLRRADGQPLVPGGGLHAQGVRDGAVLHLVPARLAWPELAYDDVVEAVAASARRVAPGWTPAVTRVAGMAAAGLPLAVGLVALPQVGTPGRAFVALGVAVLLVVAGMVTSIGYGDGPAGAALAGYAMPYALVGGGLLVAPAGATGLGWPGAPQLLASTAPQLLASTAPQLLVGSAALLLSAALGAAGVAAVPWLFAAGMTAGLLGAAGAALGLVLPAPEAAAVAMAALVCGIGVLPLLAVRLGRVPVPLVTDAAAGAATAGPSARSPAAGRPGHRAAPDRPDPGWVLAAVRRAESLLTGVLVGHAAATAVAAAVLLGGGVAARLLVGVAGVSLLLRARLFAAVRQRVPVLAAGASCLAALALDGAAGAGSQGGALVLVGFAAAAGVAAVMAGATYARRPPSPYLSRAADLADMALVVSVAPVACAVTGLYGLVLGVTG
ncbi:MAG TPA: type VII secretion integral membrane protein EccD [Micromonosporaceae bacterium]|nr:type VII secretion integral membrane protein EccD [Micromonosporaceae bacterium]